MRGKVLSFNGSTGLISGDDGKRYTFSVSDLMGDTVYVPAGSTIDFEPAGDTAVSIYVIATAIGEKNKWIAAILAFFFGALGVHKFYLGKNTAGIIMLLCGTIGWVLIVPGVLVCFIAFIETIIYLVKTDQSFYEDYVAGDKSWF
ncbi:membrane protein [Asticcacaulis sp. AC466]|uniref:TM2 domain-containing protein n=1 Tax=Asticcacaulis sp. AC466 TaxID=1282362 RepID=UPI0003C3C45C|nr:TM2 domain-containing protein [Asticcacaulis sp. AC466]ESQ84307.1 membrane protein [Asticcacaulis sp. AC466]